MRGEVKSLEKAIHELEALLNCPAAAADASGTCPQARAHTRQSPVIFTILATRCMSDVAKFLAEEFEPSLDLLGLDASSSSDATPAAGAGAADTSVTFA